MKKQVRSRLLQQLEQRLVQVQADGDRHLTHVLRAQRAVALTRHGELELARTELTALHHIGFASPSTELAAWLYLGEGLMAFSRDFGANSEQSLRQGLNLARAGGHREAEVMALGWLAAVAYLSNEIENIIDCAGQALALATPDDDAYITRALMAVAMTYHYVGDIATARRWYDATRSRAMRVGDDAMMAILLFSSAELRMLQVRQAELRGDVEHLPGQMVGIESVTNYDRAIGFSVMPEMRGLLQAKALVTEGAFEQAIEAYERHLPHARLDGVMHIGSPLLADLAWCRAALGHAEVARSLATQAIGVMSPQVDVSDVATTHARLHQAFTALGDAAAAAHHHAQADAAWLALDARRKDWLAQLQASGLQPP